MMKQKTQLVYGFHSVEALLNSQKPIERVLIDTQKKDMRSIQLIKLVREFAIELEHASSEQLDKITHNQNHQGVVAFIEDTIATQGMISSIKDLLSTTNNMESAIVLILDGITDPHNLGAIIRSAEYFGVSAIILPRNNSANISNPTVAKVSSGAISYIPVITVNNLVTAINELQQCGFWVAGTTLANDSVDLFDFVPDKKIAWVMGNEGDGIRRLVLDNCDYKVKIISYGNTESLNVSVATGIILSYTKEKERLGC